VKIDFAAWVMATRGKDPIKTKLALRALESHVRIMNDDHGSVQKAKDELRRFRDLCIELEIKLPSNLLH
jgi:hypothetical protein